MNYLIAKIKGARGQYFKVLSDADDVYSLPENLENRVAYDPAYKLEEDEWFIIDNFSDTEFFIEFLRNRFHSTDYSQIPTSDYSKIEYLCAYQDNQYFFQKISDSLLIQKKYVSFSQTPVFVQNEPIIIVNKVPDAIYDKNSDILFFRKLSTISSIFRGIASLYKEATQSETEQFLQNNFIQLEDGYEANKVKTANRKRIALAMDTLSTYSDEDRQSIFSYIKGYCEDLQYDESNSHFKLKSEDDLKKLLYGIEQRYYTTVLGGEKRLANSVLVLS
ncbi:ATP F0F1 synthase synthase [Paenibacillus chitinolyticus]|uniref:ATP F0F1 synthase synthase n=1 Tax=Paenibacillus chitinolyticus TaxID=79263 RepID=UPI0038636F2C